MSNPNNYICIHGHFYQPPRENPWLGVIEPQPGAAPFHDWNERISAECYTACARARIHDTERRIKRLANNYLNLSFNIGPTLFRWMANHHPNTVRRIVAADRQSCDEYDGHGNAVAQAYNHLIMPLCSERDLHTQIIWGMREFEFRYGRTPEGMWLPECAINMDTVRALIDHGIKFTILAPNQAERVRHFDSHDWQHCANNPIDTRVPYRVFDSLRDGQKDYSRYLDVFFYDGDISMSVAFDHVLRNADKFVGRFRDKFDQHAHEPRLIAAATDGESYGHHEPFGEMCLAFFYEELVKQHGDPVTNFAHFLSIQPPHDEVELYLGHKGEGSSWSCSHGVDRWLRHCGCAGGDSAWRQDWREPLRSTFDEIRGLLDHIFEERGIKIFRDPWDARDAYINVVLDRSHESRDRFLLCHAPEALKNPRIEREAWLLLEMQHNRMMMYTSCGWFFEDVARLEPVQNMRYALRAIEHAQKLTGEDYRGRLRDGLGRARSNQGEEGSGADIFSRYVESSVYTEERIAASYAMLGMYGLEQPPFAYDVDFIRSESGRCGELETFHGVLRMESRELNFPEKYAFFAAQISDRETACRVRRLTGPESAEDFFNSLCGLPEEELKKAMSEDALLIRDLPPEQRKQLLEHLLSSRLNDLNLTFEDDYRKLRPLLAILAENNVKPPQVLESSAHFVLEKRLREICNEMAKKDGFDPQLAEEARHITNEANEFHMEINRKSIAPILADVVLSHMELLCQKLDVKRLDTVKRLMELTHEVGFFFENCGKIENRYWYILRHEIVPIKTSLDENRLQGNAKEEAEGVLSAVLSLGEALKFAPGHLDSLIEFTRHTQPDEGEI